MIHQVRWWFHFLNWVTDAGSSLNEPYNFSLRSYIDQWLIIKLYLTEKLYTSNSAHCVYPSGIFLCFVIALYFFLRNVTVHSHRIIWHKCPWCKKKDGNYHELRSFAFLYLVSRALCNEDFAHTRLFDFIRSRFVLHQWRSLQGCETPINILLSLQIT